MSLQSRLILAFLAGLVLVVVAAQGVQYWRISGKLGSMADSNAALVQKMVEQNAISIFTSVERAISGSLKRGEMEKFDQLVREQRHVPGLLEFSLYDNEGRISSSTVLMGSDIENKHIKSTRYLTKECLNCHDKEKIDLGWEIPLEDTMTYMRSLDEKTLRHGANTIEIFQPQKVVADCIRCHHQWRLGEVRGVTHFKFSKAALLRVESKIKEALGQIKRDTLWTSLGVAVVMVLVLTPMGYFYTVENARLLGAQQQAEEEYRSLYENSVQGLFRMTSDRIIYGANPAMVQLLGHTPHKDLLALDSSERRLVFEPEEKEEAFQRTMAKEGAVLGIETQIRRVDGRLIWVVLSARAVKNDRGEVGFIEGSLIDITERIQKEEAEREKDIALAAHEHITDSIQYSRRIQNSFLPDQNEICLLFAESFAIPLPRDIVGGDFIFTCRTKEGIVVVVVDCTGHGVPGALMTVIASAGLEKIIHDLGVSEPVTILQHLSRHIKTTLGQDIADASSESDDGLDAAVCRVSSNNRFLDIASAKSPMFYVQGGVVKTVKGDRQSIGYKRSDPDFKFTHVRVPITEKTLVFMCTDGIYDQVGGPIGIPFGYKKIRQGLIRLEGESMPQLGQRLLKTFLDFQGDQDRRDDVTMLGFCVDSADTPAEYKPRTQVDRRQRPDRRV